MKNKTVVKYPPSQIQEKKKKRSQPRFRMQDKQMFKRTTCLVLQRKKKKPVCQKRLGNEERKGRIEVNYCQSTHTTPIFILFHSFCTQLSFEERLLRTLYESLYVETIKNFKNLTK